MYENEGYPPSSEGGTVRHPELNMDELRALPRHEHITQHFCIQGWSRIARRRDDVDDPGPGPTTPGDGSDGGYNTDHEFFGYIHTT